MLIYKSDYLDRRLIAISSSQYICIVLFSASEKAPVMDRRWKATTQRGNINCHKLVSK